MIMMMMMMMMMMIANCKLNGNEFKITTCLKFNKTLNYFVLIYERNSLAVLA